MKNSITKMSNKTVAIILCLISLVSFALYLTFQGVTFGSIDHIILVISNLLAFLSGKYVDKEN